MTTLTQLFILTALLIPCVAQTDVGPSTMAGSGSPVGNCSGTFYINKTNSAQYVCPVQGGPWMNAGVRYISSLPHGMSMLMRQPSGATICDTTPTTSLWATDIQPTFFPGSVMTHVKMAFQVAPWNRIQTAMNTYSFTTFNTNCLTNQFGAANMAAGFQNERVGGILTNDALPGWYNSLVSLNTCARATTTTGNCVTTSTTPLFTVGSVFCIYGTTLTGATSFNGCGAGASEYTVTAVSSSGNNTTITWSHAATANGTDTATGGFANDITGTRAGSNCGGITGGICAGLVATSFARSGTCPSVNCVVTVTLNGSYGSFLNSIPASPTGSYAGDQIQISGSTLTGTSAFDGVHVICTVASGITGCINPTATSFTYTQPLAANNTDTATGGFVGNPIVSDPSCHPHTQATKWIPNFLNAWENFWTQVQATEDSLGLNYLKVELGVGDENRIANNYCSNRQTPGGCACKTNLQADADVSTPISDTAWLNQLSAFEAYINSLNFVTPLDSSTNVLQSTDYQNADLMAVIHLNNGFGIGNQALNNTDITTAAAGGKHYGKGNDSIYVFPRYCAITTWCQGQGLAADDETGANDATVTGNGRLTKALDFYLNMRMSVYECFFDSCLSAWDSGWCPWTIGTCTSTANQQANFQSFSTTSLQTATSVTLTGAALVDNDSVGIFSASWPNTMSVCIGGTAATCSDGELALISSCTDTKHCTLQTSPGNLTAVPFKTYFATSQLGATAGYASYLTGVATQLQ